MKKCAHCGQEIPSDAAICGLCSRAQPAPRYTPKPSGIGSINAGRLSVLVAVSTVALMAFVMKWPAPQPDVRPKPAGQATLKITGSRHSHGLEVTNREDEVVRECVVRIPEQWTTTVAALAPQETATVEWARFRSAKGAVMPDHIGQNTRYATVSCASHKDTHKGAALAFR